MDSSKANAILEQFEKSKRVDVAYSDDELVSLNAKLPPVLRAKKHFFVTQQMYEECERKHTRYTLCVFIEFLVLLLYLLFVILVLDIENVFVRYSLHHYVKSRFDGVKFKDTDRFMYNIDEIYNSTESVLKWYKAAIIDNPRIEQYFEKPGLSKNPTQLVGSIIISKIQLNSNCNDSVTLNKTTGEDDVLRQSRDELSAGYYTFEKCYPPYSQKFQDTKNFTDGYRVYTVCHHCDTDFEGDFAVYHPNSHQIVLKNTKDEIKSQFDHVSTTHWSTKSVRLLMMKVHFVNIPTHMFSVIKIAMETPPTGSIFPKIYIRTGSVIAMNTLQFEFLMCVLILLWIILVFLELYEAYYFQWRYFCLLGQYLDLLVLIPPCVSFFYFSLMQYFGPRAWKRYQKFPKHSMDFAISTRESFTYYLVVSLVAGFFRSYRYLCLWSCFTAFSGLISNITTILLPSILLFLGITFVLAIAAHVLLFQKSDSYSSILKSWFMTITFSTRKREHYDYEVYWRETVVVVVYFMAVFILIISFTKVMVLYWYRQMYPFTVSQEGPMLTSILCGPCTRKKKQWVRAWRQRYTDLENNLGYYEIRYTLMRLGFDEHEFRVFKKKYVFNYDNTIKVDYWPLVLNDLEDTNLEMIGFDSEEEIEERRLTDAAAGDKSILSGSQLVTNDTMSKEQYEKLVYLMDRIELVSEIGIERCEMLSNVLYFFVENFEIISDAKKAVLGEDDDVENAE